MRSGGKQTPPVVRLQYGTPAGVKTLDIPTGGEAIESQDITGQVTDPKFGGRSKDNECEIGYHN